MFFTMKLIKANGDQSLLPSIQEPSYSPRTHELTVKRYVIDMSAEGESYMLITDTLTIGEHEKVFFMNSSGNTVSHYKGAML